MLLSRRAITLLHYTLGGYFLKGTLLGHTFLKVRGQQSGRGGRHLAIDIEKS